MEFLAIMGIGTLVAIWIVANLPKSRGLHRELVSLGEKICPSFIQRTILII
jgi:hypothetical protein